MLKVLMYVLAGMRKFHRFLSPIRLISVSFSTVAYYII